MSSIKVTRLPAGQPFDTGTHLDTYANFRYGAAANSRDKTRVMNPKYGGYQFPKEYDNTIHKSNYPNTKVVGSGIAQSSDGTWVVADCSVIVCGYHTKEEAQARWRIVRAVNKSLTSKHWLDKFEDILASQTTR